MYILNKNYRLTNLGLELESAAHAIVDSAWHGETVSEPYSKLYYIKEGKGFIKIKDKVTELTAGNVYLVPTGCVYDCGCEYLEKIYFHFYVNTFEKYDLLAKVNKIYSLPFSKAEYDELKSCLEADDYFKLMKIKLILYETLVKISEKYNFKKVDIKQYSDGVKKAMGYIYSNTRINLTTEIVSENLFISKSKLRKDFKNETGISIGKYIDEMVFQKAKRLLYKENLSISDISQKLGFCDQFYFSRQFKARYNMPPSEYRKQLMIEKSKGESMMKVILINGSPKKNGCTNEALKEVADALDNNGIETEIVHVGTKTVDCMACGACKKTGRCVIDDGVNKIIEKLPEVDGIVVGSPVYYAGPSGHITSFLDRLFHAGSGFDGKVGAAVVSCRRGGASAAFDRLNKYFQISCMPVVSSQYWNQVHGSTPEDVHKDEEGMQTMRTLGNNMAWLIKCIKSGEEMGIKVPEREKAITTSFIR